MSFFHHYYQYASPWLCPYVSCVCTQLMASLELSRLPKGVKIFVAQFLSNHMTTMIVTCMYQVVMTPKKWAWSVRWRSGQIPPPFKTAAGIVVSIDVKSNLANLKHFTHYTVWKNWVAKNILWNCILLNCLRSSWNCKNHNIWHWLKLTVYKKYNHPITKFWFMTSIVLNNPCCF